MAVGKVTIKTSPMAKLKIAAVLLFTSINYLSLSQVITGKVVNDATGDPLEFSSVGIVGHAIGDITDSKGNFRLTGNSLSKDAQVRISMIGFQAQTFYVRDLLDKENILRLKEQTVGLSEVVVKSSKTKRNTIGTKSSTKHILTGWGAAGEGGERGLRIEIKGKPIFIEKLNFHIAYNQFDSVLIRLHIRKIENGTPSEELLHDNILTISRSAGWVEIDLSKYNLFYSEDIAVTLEWVKAWGLFQKDFYNNGTKFSLNYFKGTLFAKEASESNWTVFKHKSPGIYLTVQQ